MMLYYNGERLPRLPVHSDYPYCFIYRNPNSTGEHKYRCTFSKNKYFFQSSDLTLRPGSNTVINYWIRENLPATDSVWEERDATVYYYNDAGNLLWSNYDISADSQSGSTIWRAKSHIATLFDIGLTQQWDAYVGSDHTELDMTMENCTVGNVLILAYAVRGVENSITLSPGWEILGGGNNASDESDVYQRVYFAMKRVENATEAVSITQTETSPMYAVCGEFVNVKSVSMRDDLASKGNTDYTVLGDKQDADAVLLYATSAAYYGSGRLQKTTPDDLEKLLGSSSAERLAAWFDGGAGAVEHSFVVYPNTGNRDAVLECIQLFPYDRRYLIRSGNVYYTVIDDTLTPLQDGEETEAFFLENGVSEQPDDSFLSGLDNPEILLWSDYPQRTLQMSGQVTGVPLPQTIFSQNYDMTDLTILGIESVSVDASADALFAVSFDNGESWKMYTGSAWATLSGSGGGMSAGTLANIPSEAWATVAVTGTIRLRVTLPGSESYVGAVTINYLNQGG